jgi:putative redox protein
MNPVKVSFPGSSGGTLDARLEMPERKPVAFALFAHCFTCGKDARAAVKIARALAARGIATLRFDFTGLGGSEGEFSNTNFSSNVADLVAAADYLRGAHMAPALLIGHSLGGAAVLAACGGIPESLAVVTIGAPLDAAHVEHIFMDAVPRIEAEGEAVATLGGRKFTLRKQLLDDIRAQRQQERLAKLGRALLVMHAPTDGVVGIDNASRIYAAAKHPKSFISLHEADHFLTGPADADYAAAVIAAWVSRYLPAAAAAAEAEMPAREGEVVVEDTGRGRLQQRIAIGPHQLLADEPASLGGLGSAPTPYDLLAASLGACKAMTMRLYAERKGLPLDHVRVTVAHDKIHAADCMDCETKAGQIDSFRVRIEAIGPLAPEQRAQVIAIAKRCPVHRTLTGEVKIRTEGQP